MKKEILKIQLSGLNSEDIHKIIKSDLFDLNCGGPKETDKQTFTLEIFGTKQTVSQLKRLIPMVSVQSNTITKELFERQNEVGRGNRYKNSRSIPKGIGKKQ